MIQKFFKWIFGGCDHKWTKWEITRTEDLIRSINGTCIGKSTFQSRRCNNCGFTEEKINSISIF
jgi:hypothetical protein